MLDKLSSTQKRSLLILLIVAFALPFTIALVKQTQIFKPRAENNVYDNFDVTGPDGAPLNYDLGVQRVYKTDSLDVKIKIKDIHGLVP